MSVESSSFFRKVEELSEKIGTGNLRGELEINQHYALDQEFNTNYEHPRGGGPFYLSGQLLKHVPEYLEKLRLALEVAELKEAMIANMEDLSAKMDPAAPIDEDPNPIRLRRSGHPRVWDGTELVYDRQPIDPREPFLVPGKNEDDVYDENGFKKGVSYGESPIP